MKKKKNGFTLVELLVGLVLISIGLLSVISMVRSSISYTDRTRQDVLAINLAREGMESVYTIRNTNRLRRSGIKDQNRLCQNPNVELTDDNTSCGMRIQSGVSYIMQYTGSQQRYPSLLAIANQKLNLSDGSDVGFALKYGSLSGQTNSGWYQDGTQGNPTSEGLVYREIRGIGLFQKDTNQTGGVAISCTYGTGNYTGISITGASFTSSCGDSRPKEFRFCSKVEYQKQTRGKVELCGIVTNYEE